MPLTTAQCGNSQQDPSACSRPLDVTSERVPAAAAAAAAANDNGMALETGRHMSAAHAHSSSGSLVEIRSPSARIITRTSKYDRLRCPIGLEFDKLVQSIVRPIVSPPSSPRETSLANEFQPTNSEAQKGDLQGCCRARHLSGREASSSGRLRLSARARCHPPPGAHGVISVARPGCGVRRVGGAQPTADGIASTRVGRSSQRVGTSPRRTAAGPRGWSRGGGSASASQVPTGTTPSLHTTSWWRRRWVRVGKSRWWVRVRDGVELGGEVHCASRMASRQTAAAQTESGCNTSAPAWSCVESVPATERCRETRVMSPSPQSPGGDHCARMAGRVWVSRQRRGLVRDTQQDAGEQAQGR